MRSMVTVVAIVCALCGIANVAAAQVIHNVVGMLHNGATVWEYNGSFSPAQATLNTSANRLKINAKVGDTVKFTVEGVSDLGVVFEHAAAEQNVLWTVTTTPNPLKLIDGNFVGFDPIRARTTGPVLPGQTTIITIKLTQVTGANGILFGGDPDSEAGAADKKPMLGVIVVTN
ncbi:MAG TPA: hypothetical protein VHC22_33380 [Pirellulales bacterium]|nr:hypothetical protein [Pirellulales bacterium]